MTSIFTNSDIEYAWILISEHSFRLKKIDQEIVIKVYKDLHNDRYFHSLSHHIKVPGQSDIHTHGTPYPSEAALLNSVIKNTILTHYRGAVKAKHTPDKSWLIPNENF